VKSASNIHICRNIILENHACYGAGLSCRESTGDIIANNTIAKNEANGQGGGIFLSRSSAFLTNNTITENQAPNGGAGVICLDRTTVDLCNSILWENGWQGQVTGQVEDTAEGDITIAGGSTGTGDIKGDITIAGGITIAGDITGDGDVTRAGDVTREEIFIDANSSCKINYSDIRVGESNLFWLAGAGNMDKDPAFRGEEPGKYHLLPSSPCRGAADPNQANPDGSACDLGAFGGEDADWSILLLPMEDQHVRAGESLAVKVRASIPDRDACLHYSDDSDLFEIDPAIGEINFTPVSSQAGEYEITITVTDCATDNSGRSAICPFHLTVEPGQATIEPSQEPSFSSWQIFITFPFYPFRVNQGGFYFFQDWPLFFPCYWHWMVPNQRYHGLASRKNLQATSGGVGLM
jgi:parallel beta-helix repeat protein